MTSPSGTDPDGLKTTSLHEIDWYAIQCATEGSLLEGQITLPSPNQTFPPPRIDLDGFDFNAKLNQERAHPAPKSFEEFKIGYHAGPNGVVDLYVIIII